MPPNGWILFYENERMIYLNPVWFLKGNNYLLEALYLLKYRSQFKEYLKKLQKTISNEAFPKNDNVQSLILLYSYNNKFNLHFLEGSFKEGLPLVEEVLQKIKRLMIVLMNITSWFFIIKLPVCILELAIIKHV